LFYIPTNDIPLRALQLIPKMHHPHSPHLKCNPKFSLTDVWWSETIERERWEEPLCTSVILTRAPSPDSKQQMLTLNCFWMRFASELVTRVLLLLTTHTRQTQSWGCKRHKIDWVIWQPPALCHKHNIMFPGCTRTTSLISVSLNKLHSTARINLIKDSHIVAANMH